MFKIHHPHSKPSAGQSVLLAAVWYGALQISPISIAHFTGGHSSRFSDCYSFLFTLNEFVGGIHEEHFGDRPRRERRLLQVTA